MAESQLSTLLEPFAAIAKELEQQNILLREIASNTSATLELTKKMHWEASESRKIQNNIRLSAMRPVFDEVHDLIKGRQLSYLDTLERIRDENLSFARFGDGELRLMVQPEYGLRFQKNSAELRLSLQKVLHDPVPGLMVGMPNLFADTHWSVVWAEIWSLVKPFAGSQKEYGNSHTSRPVFFQQYREEAVNAWSSLWNGKSAVIVTGEGSRFDLVDPLFSGLTFSETLHSLPAHAYDDLPRILDALRRNKADVVLISLGPAGTVLTHLLAQEGRQALDIGHLSASYLHALEGGAFPEAMPAVR